MISIYTQFEQQQEIRDDIIGNLSVHTYLLSLKMVLQHKFPFVEPKSGDIGRKQGAAASSRQR